MTSLVPFERIKKQIFLLRGHKVMFDHDLADLYGIKTKALIQALKRNLERFPADFMFQLNNQDVSILRSQSVTSRFWGGRRYNPYAFTEQGVAMLSSILKSQRAIQVNIEIMRAFVYLRELLGTNKSLAAKLEALEKKYDSQFKVVFDAIRQLMTPASKDKPNIGFTNT
jgi:hypothetical protein